MTRERIEDMREVVLPFVKKRLLETNYEGLGEADAKEFEREFNEILNLAIKALEQEPTTRNCFGCKYAKDNHNSGTEECHLCMWENQYTPTTKNDLGVDCISRQCVLDKIQRLVNAEQNNIDENGDYMNYARERVNAYEAIQFFVENDCLCPSVTPQEPRKGHWLRRPHVYGVTYCSICDFELKIDNTNYCPNCGAKMESEVDNEN